MYDLAHVWRNALLPSGVAPAPTPVAQAAAVATEPVSRAPGVSPPDQPVTKPVGKERPLPHPRMPLGDLGRIELTIAEARRPRRGFTPTNRDLAIAAVNALCEPSDAVIEVIATMPVGPAIRLAKIAIHGTPEQRARLKVRIRWRAAIEAILGVVPAPQTGPIAECRHAVQNAPDQPVQPRRRFAKHAALPNECRYQRRDTTTAEIEEEGED